MIKNKIQQTAPVAVLLFMLLALCSWGNWGHMHINKASVFALPEAMRQFYYNHIDYITEESVGPDLRKYTLGFKSEGPRHYIDIEDFEKPIDSLPRTPKEASALYEEKMLAKSGSLPWYIQEIMVKLTRAMQERRREEILLLSADLGHYLGDACMPLHTSSNHDGQLTAQSGIHSFWESQLPEIFGDKYNLHVADATYISDVPAETWAVIKHSHQLVDSVLLVDRELRKAYSSAQMYKTDEKGNVVKNKFNQPVHSTEYATRYHTALHGMVEAQMRAAIKATADYWFTAWVNAGKPDLNSLDDEELTTSNKAAYSKDLKAWEQGHVTKIKPDNEF